MVNYLPGGLVLVGRNAINAPGGTKLYQIKSMMGTRCTKPGKHVKRPYGIVYFPSEKDVGRAALRVKKGDKEEDVDPVLVGCWGRRPSSQADARPNRMQTLLAPPLLRRSWLTSCTT